MKVLLILVIILAVAAGLAILFYFIVDACELDIPSEDGYYETHHDEYYNPYL